jgi:putative tryptophan/tyrosine transport system substrate-binding protein
MRRREFIALVGGSMVAAPRIVKAEAQKITRVGMLIPSAPDAPATRENLGAVRQGLADLGYIEGQNILFEQRGGDGTPERLKAMAAELVEMKVDLIVAISTPAARAAQQATTTIPIVVGSVGDPVLDGFVASLSRPGGNITGTTFLGPELVPKRFALLKEMLPDASRIAVLWNARAFSERTTAGMVDQTNDAAKRLGFKLRYVEVPSIDHFEESVATAAEDHDDAAFQFPNPTFYENRRHLVDLMAKYRLPTMYNAKEFVEAGGLIGYGASPLGLNRRTAFFVDKIIRGARPADLPVEQPTMFDLAINLKTAKALSLALPPTLLAGASEVIE